MCTAAMAAGRPMLGCLAGLARRLPLLLPMGLEVGVVPAGAGGEGLAGAGGDGLTGRMGLLDSVGVLPGAKPTGMPPTSAGQTCLCQVSTGFIIQQGVEACSVY